MSTRLALTFTVYAVGIASLLNGDYLYTLVVPLMLLGSNLNIKVCEINGGTMPVFTSKERKREEVAIGKKHHLGTEDTKLKLFADIIDIKGFGIMSIGDVLNYISIIASYTYMYNKLAATF